ncbi:MAG: MBL fold metallo-hydrolase [Candidatus Aenigmarchaeota archaeon]|nr:MBL fold metallo-hydrolase [Candidatus Aenigmarchaeota archaeon]
MRINKISDTVSVIHITPLDSNIYIINNTLLIDTTTGHHATLIKKALNALDISPDNITCIINTHTHMDHIGGNHLFKNAKIMMHESAKTALEEPTLKNTFSKYFNTTLKNPAIHIPLNDSDTIRAKGTKLEIIHTPGHSPDSISIYMPEQKYLFTGDAIPVRPDKKLSAYIKNRETPKETLKKLHNLEINMILPGHGKTINNPQQIKELLNL